MCQHTTRCPSATAPEALSARVVSTRYEQGWSLLCNGIVVFDDLGALLPDGSSVCPSQVRPHERYTQAA